jgi:hypothetical protein
MGHPASMKADVPTVGAQPEGEVDVDVQTAFCPWLPLPGGCYG